MPCAAHALTPGPLRDLATTPNALADTAERASGPHATYDSYQRSLNAVRYAATEPGWADARSFTFRRSLTERPETVWRHLTEADLLVHWWTPEDLRVSERCSPTAAPPSPPMSS
ncbi:MULTISPECIES: SRPBCC family protein [Streptomyces]|uniref:SRPBCC family protein n=1 Tax=Streptomyces TaxID=1883 RepID=UPI0029B10069|nr:hypothetical protein [Streptomyces sp. WI03-4A]MDX2591559.1 hypothetical protein [Streptomyces sp. WI03-4A]